MQTKPKQCTSGKNCLTVYTLAESQPEVPPFLPLSTIYQDLSAYDAFRLKAVQAL